MNGTNASRGERRLRALSWATLLFGVGVVLGGAVVRATDSGAGCGESWPRCDGRLFPASGATETLVEFGHRLSTALLTVGVAALVLLARRLRERGDPLRLATAAAGGFLVVEIIIGAVLVLFGWVEDDASAGRMIAVPLHLVNTFFLLGALAVAVRAATHRPRWSVASGATRKLVLGGVIMLLLIGGSGALNALADTLYPATSLADGFAAELSPSAPLLLRIRVLHPVIAAAGGIAIVTLAGRLGLGIGGDAERLARIVIGLVLGQFLVGLVNLALLTPLELQVLHLAIADAVWIGFVMLAATRVDEPVAEPSLEVTG